MSKRKVSIQKNLPKNRNRKPVVRVLRIRKGNRVLSPVRLKKVQFWATWVSGHNKGGYRWLAKWTTRSYGWWQQVGCGNPRLRITEQDYHDLKNIYGILQLRIDQCARDLMLDILHHRAAMDTDLNKLFILMQRHAESDSVQPTDNV